MVVQSTLPLGSTLASSWVSMNLRISSAAEGGPGSACSTPCSPKASTVGGAGPRFDWKTPRSPKTSTLIGVAASFLLMGVAEFLLGVFEGVLFWVRLGDLAGRPRERGTFGDVSTPRIARVFRRPGLWLGRARAAMVGTSTRANSNVVPRCCFSQRQTEQRTP